VLPSRPFRASKLAFVTSRAAECERFRVVRDYFRDYSDRQRLKYSELFVESLPRPLPEPGVSVAVP
jgi:hypothetical protein